LNFVTFSMALIGVFNCGSLQHSDDQTCIGLIVLLCLCPITKRMLEIIFMCLRSVRFLLYDLWFLYQVLPQLSSASYNVGLTRVCVL